METFSFQYDWQAASYILEELEDGFWNVSCDHDLFRLIMGSRKVQKAESLTEVLQEIGKVNLVLMNAMWTPFYASYQIALQRYSQLKNPRDLNL